MARTIDLQLDLFTPRSPAPLPAPPPPVHPTADALDEFNVIALAPLPEAAVEPTAPVPTAAEPARNQNNYRITDADQLGHGSLKTKCHDNLRVIEVLKELEREARPPTSEERRLLVRYVGWGGLPQVFDDRNEAWQTEREQLEQRLTPDELNSARATTLNAHYTSPTIIRAIYAALARFGFEHGRMLEPACGLGHFIGCLPESMLSRSHVTAVEIDSVTARLARQLYPDADIRHSPFESARLPDEAFDVAVSNIPFGDYQPFDPRFKKWKFPIHDYFFAAALTKVRPGGLILFITSRGTLDKIDAGLRTYLEAHADFLGAIRLPNDAFKKNAHTEVTTDLVMLRKRCPGEASKSPPWRTLTAIPNSLGEIIAVNEYFAAHPEMMLGEMRLEGRMYGRGEPTLVGTGGDLSEQLAQAIARLPANIYRPEPRIIIPLRPEPVIPAPDEVKPNAYALVNGQLARREGDTMQLLTDLPAAVATRVRGLIRIRDAVRRCLKTQLEDAPETELIVAREQLNQVYDHYVSRQGALSERTNTAAFRGDPDLPLLLSLEHYDSETKRARKAAIFRERTVQRQRSPVRVESARDALLVTLGERGQVDVEHLSCLLHRPEEQVLAELKGLIFLNPQSMRWETDDDYLSGNVREKLRLAEASGEAFQSNVEALRAVQPTDLTPSEIDIRLGTAWVPEEDIRAFAQELLGESDLSICHAAQLGLWTVRGGWSARGCVANTTEWGTDRITALELLEMALNLRTPTIYDEDPVNDRKVINGSATEAARDKQEKIKERFKQWIWKDEERSARLSRIYNETFNSLRLRVYNGDHLTLPGASPAIVLHRHQKAAVWRILQSPNCLLAHVVGAGKTFTMCAAAMELRRLGLARKPLMVVPNHMLGQFSAELLMLYPAANLLVATRDDFEKEKRGTLMSRMATGNWDAIIVTHSGFEKIPVSQRTQEALVEDQLRELTLAVEEQRREDGNSRIVKMLERDKRRLETRLRELAAEARKDDLLTFEELGVDRLFVDEAHYFKNLFYVTKMTRVAGLPQTASQRAFDMFLKVMLVQRANSGGGVVFATGTPIANSVAEMFTMQRYLQLTSLKSLGLEHFDSWAATFGEPVTAMELSPDGSGYRLNTRFARFINVPELMRQFRQVADIQTQSMLKLSIPEVEGGRPTTINAPASPELKSVVASLVKRAEALRSGRVRPSDDNMLLVTTDGRKAALDLRLYDPALPDHAQSKVNLAVEQIHRVWTATADCRGAQLVFCDLSTPGKGAGFSVYEELRDKLITRGVPREQIEFIQDHDTDTAKLELFRAVRAGRVRILIGSTQKMGAGTNVQERLVALHHLDAPWRPADVEQREGRILRQGNTNPVVQIFRYVTEQSFDAYLWQCLETKARFIAQVMIGECDVRRIADIDGAALTYAEVKAIASGNPLVVEKANIDVEVARLARLRSQHWQAQGNIRHRHRRETEELPRLELRLAAVRQDLSRRQDTRGDRFIITIEGQEIRDRGIAGELLLRRAEKLRRTGLERAVGQFAGFMMFITDSAVGDPQVVLRGEASHSARVTDSALGTIRSVEHAIQSMEETVAALERNIVEGRKRVSDLGAQMDQPFEYQEKLDALLRRQEEIVEALDLSKNQSPSELEAEPTREATVAEPDGAALKEEYEDWY